MLVFCDTSLKKCFIVILFTILIHFKPILAQCFISLLPETSENQSLSDVSKEHQNETD